MVEAEAAKVSGGKASFTLRIRLRGQLMVQQAVIAGCAGGTYSNVMEAARVLKGKNAAATSSPWQYTRLHSLSLRTW